MKKIIGYRWHSGRATIGIVVYQTNYGNFKAVMTSVPGVNEKLELETICDYGSEIPINMAIASIDSGFGTVEDIVLWNEFKGTSPEVRMSLDSDDFKVLISGGILEKGRTKIILQDIGWDLMITLINRAQNEQD